MSNGPDPTIASGSGEPTPPSGNPTVGGSGLATGGSGPAADPTVATSVYAEGPPPGGGPTGPGGPGGPGGPQDPMDGPEEDDDRWKIYALVGLAVVVIALLIGGIVLSQGGDDDKT